MCRPRSHPTVSQGDILDNKELVASLNETKAKSQTVTAALADSAKLQADLDRQRDVYRPLAAAGALCLLLPSPAPTPHTQAHTASTTDNSCAHIRTL